MIFFRMNQYIDDFNRDFIENVDDTFRCGYME